MRTFHTGRCRPADITTGLPRVEELFEARVPKGAALLADREGVVSIEQTDIGRMLKITSTEQSSWTWGVEPGWEVQLQSGAPAIKDKTVVAIGPNDEKKLAGENGTFYLDDQTVYVRTRRRRRSSTWCPCRTSSSSRTGDFVTPGLQMTDGAKDPQQVLLTQGRDAVQRYIIDEVQKVYKSQGVNTNDKHIEVICRQMLRKVAIVYPGDTDFLQDERVDRFEFNQINEEILAQGGEPAMAIPVLLGITKASLETDSFLSAASFQETTRVLTEAAVNGKVDHLRGLKENVIIGKLIPAGSGYGVTAQQVRQTALDDLMLDNMSAAASAASVAVLEAEVAEEQDIEELMSSGLLPSADSDIPLEDQDGFTVGELEVGRTAVPES
jgi:DNA-directed RNA polymerase subunit beta'